MTITAKMIEDTTYHKNNYDLIVNEGFEPYRTDNNFRHHYNNWYVESDRLITLQLRYPRFIHSELMTHRVFSRNASSSRAIPVNRLIQDVIDDTAMPIHWGKNIAGMQAKEEHNDFIIHQGLNDDLELTREEAWLLARDNAIAVARSFSEAGYHKQIVNRLLEPFSHINVVLTSNDWKNFLTLRNHKDAQPEIEQLAKAIIDAINGSVPKLLNIGDWHLPYITQEDIDDAYERHKREFNVNITKKIYDELAKISTARCARVSYMTHDRRVPRYEEDIELYNTLLIAEPLHASPAEHQAYVGDKPTKNSNFAYSNYFQNRKLIEKNV